MYNKKFIFGTAAGAVILTCSIYFGTNPTTGEDLQTGVSGTTVAINSCLPDIFADGDNIKGSLFQVFQSRSEGTDRESTVTMTDLSEKPTTSNGSRNHVISPYDHVMRTVGQQEGADWRLMAAIAYNESRFKADVVSKVGAKGLMQIMPVVSRQFGVADEKVMDPEVNVTLAVKLLDRIEKMMKIPASAHDYDRMALVLASYNCGVGHVADARRLAAKYGSNPNSWDDVSQFLRKKSQPEYYEDAVVRNGRFRGSAQTLAFVNGVIGRYNSYCTLAAL